MSSHCIWKYWYSRRMKKPKVCAVVAIGKNRELGKDNKLLWKIPEDVQRFRDLTRGHPLIMGRKTFESILSYRGSPLPERTNIVVSRKGQTFADSQSQTFADVVVVRS